MITLQRRTLGIPLFYLLLSVGSAAAAPVDEAIDSVMYTDPAIPAAKVVKVFPTRLASLWLSALERPEDEMKRQAADAIALAQRRGMPGLKSTVTPLHRTLEQPKLHPTVRLAVAQALIEIDARESATELFKQARMGGVEMRHLVEPVLARWNHEPARAVWLDRLNSTGLPRQDRFLAIQGLGVVRETKAIPRLLELVLSPTTNPILRLEAARTLGALQTSGLEKEAGRLVTEKAGPGNVAHLAAASLLRNHRGDEAARILQRLVVESDPATVVVALDGLLDADARLVLPLLKQVISNPDGAVRSRGVEAHRKSPQREHISLIADLLDDPHPQVRTAARKTLVEVAGLSHHKPIVLREATRVLATEKWRGLEQATIVLSLLDHKPAAARLVDLLRFERPEVFVAAAWGLRRLAVAETLPAQMGEIERRWQQSMKPDETFPRAMVDVQVAQLAQSLGRALYAPASLVLARFVPKQGNIGPESRAAAIWALGLIHQKAPPDRLVEAVDGRLTDESTIVEEDLRVRAMAAIALGRMNAKETANSLRKYYPRRLSVEPFPNACGWALQQLTGEPLPASGTVELIQKGWFLEPND